MIYGPLFGSPIVPGRVKVLLAFTLGAAVYPFLAGNVLAGQPALELSLWTLLPVIALELLIGLIIGFVASLPLIAVQIGGRTMGMQMGLGFARIVDPASGVQSDVLSQFFFMMAMAGFMLIGGLEAMVLAVLHSFEHVPLGRFAVDLDLIALLIGLLTSAFELALRVAAPLLALIFLESLAMGFVAKTVPQLNILSLGFPLRILAGLSLLVVGITVVDEVIMEEIDAVIVILFEWIGSRGG
jgi:flagellar biosynthetic protein FliR